MKNLRHWQILLGTLLLIGLFDLLYMLFDLDGAMVLRGEMMHLMTDGEGMAGTMRVADLIPAKVLGFFTLALGGLLVWRGLHLRSAQALIAFIILFNIPAFTLFKLGMPTESLFQMATVVNVAWMLLLVLFAALFPRRLTPEDLVVVRKSGGRIRRVLGSPFRWLRLKMLEPRAAMIAVVLVLVLSVWPAGLFPLLFTLVSLWLAASYLRAGFLVADEEGRRRVLWIVNGFSGAFWLMLIGTVGMFLVSVSVGISHGIAHELGHADDLLIPYWILLGVEWVYIFAMLAILVSIVAAILYRGAMDPGLVLRKTTVYGALGVCLAFVFAILENILSSQVAVRFDMPGATGGWLAGGLTALAIGPLHHLIKRRSDRFIDRLLPARQPGDSRDERVFLLVGLKGYARLSSETPDAASTAASLLRKVAQRAANRFGGRVQDRSEGRVELEVADAAEAQSVAGFVEDAYAAAAEMMELPALKVTTEICEPDSEPGR